MTISPKAATLIFDFDGTIADTFDFYLKTINSLSLKFKFQEIKPDQIEHFRHLSSHQIVDLLRIPKSKLPFIIWEARKLLRKGISHISPFNGIKEIIEEIRKEENVLLGILTSNSVQNVRTFLKSNNFPEFDFVFSSMQLWNKSKTLKRVIHRHKLKPNTVFYVGDETRDIEAVQKAGIKSIAVTWGYNSSEILQSYSPDFLISDPYRLITIMNKWIR